MGGGSDIIEFMKTIKRYISTTSRISLSTISYSITYILIGVVIFLTLTPIALAQSLPATDRDTDDDGLIEISTLSQLHVIRYDGDGDGQSTESIYNTRLGSSLTNSGCPSTCTGYELTADLDFDTNGNGSYGSGDAYYNGGIGWNPLGTADAPFNTTFHGNGHTISNLTVKRSTHYRGGLFGELGSDSIIRNLGLEGVTVSARGATASNPGDHGVGGLAGVNRGLIYHTYTTGVVAGKGQQRYSGGLVGLNLGRILASYSNASVSGDYDVGGLVGHNKGSVIWTYATGDVSHRGFDAGGLVGEQSSDGEIKYSYSTGDVTDGNSNSPAGGLTSDKSDSGTITQSYFDSDRSNRPSSDPNSKTPSQLQSPTSASGIFSDWGKAEHIIYEGTLTPSTSGTKSGYEKDNFGSLSPTAIGSYTIEKLYYLSILPGSIYIRITENDTLAYIGTDILTVGDTITLIQGSTTITSPITELHASNIDADRIFNNLPESTVNEMFQGSSPFTIRFGEPIAGTDHTVDVPNLWDFGTSSDLPLLSVDFNGDGTASTVEFGEQGLDHTKPVITLNGDDTVSLVEGTAYTDAGATVRDPGNTSYSGTVSTAISGPDGQTSFDSAVVGDWTFTYTASADSSGNVPDAVSRVVTVTERPTTIFSATFTPGNVVFSEVYGHRLPNKNALTDDDGNAHNTFTLGGVEYTVYYFYFDAQELYFMLKAGSNDVDERTVFADYSLVIVNENDETFTKEITGFRNDNVREWVKLTLRSDSNGLDPLKYDGPWDTWIADDTITVDFSIVETDKTKPVITLNGDDTITLIENTAYTDEGATVADPRNSDYTGTVSTAISGPDGQTSFDNTVLGDWTFTYTAPADAFGNVPDSVIRTVTVVTLSVDRDTDDDGLIEISTLAQLNAMRYDLDGDGTSGESAYNPHLGSTITNSGCPSTCKGYELTADLDFDTNGDDSFDSGDDYYNGGDGWEPIGDGTNTFNTTFNGNGHTISNLTVDRSTSHWGGLFGELGTSAVVRNLGLVDASVSAMGANQNNPGEHGVGALTGVNRGTIYHTYSTGSVTGEGAQRHTGGLVGRNFGYVLASYSSASVSGNYDIGGLVGYNDGSVLWTYATGRVRNNGFDGGGLVGDQSSDATLAYSYSTADVTSGFGNSNAGGLISGSNDGTIIQSYFDSGRSNRPSSDSYSKTSFNLQIPVSAIGIFSQWGAPRAIYEGTLTPGENARGTKFGYLKDDFGSLSLTTIGSAIIKQFDFAPRSASRIFVTIEENGNSVNLSDLLNGANVLGEEVFLTLIQGSTSVTLSFQVEYSIINTIRFTQSEVVNAVFQSGNPFTIRFREAFGGTKHTVDIANLWDFGTSRNLPLLSVDFDGDGSASVSEFGEQVDEENTAVSIDFDGNGTFTPSQDALALYLVTQLSTNANTLSSYVHDGATETASTTITLVNSLTSGTSLDFDGSETFVPSQDALALYLATQLSANANTLASYVYDRSSVTAASTITRINNLVTSTNG